MSTKFSLLVFDSFILASHRFIYRVVDVKERNCDVLTKALHTNPYSRNQTLTSFFMLICVLMFIISLISVLFYAVVSSFINKKKRKRDRGFREEARFCTSESKLYSMNEIKIGKFSIKRV